MTKHCIGTKNNLTTDPSKEYNKDGRILFTRDTQELYINDGAITSADNLPNRKQVNAQYALGLWNGPDTLPLTYQDLKNSLQNINNLYTNFQQEMIDNLAKKMDKTNPEGNGVLNIGSNTKTSSNLTGALIGNNLVQGVTNNNAIISGQYNKYEENGLLIIGNGTNNMNRKNALSIIKKNNNSYAVFETNIYANGAMSNENKLITQTELNEAVGNVITTPYVVSPIEPTSEEDKKLLWINTAKGNGILNYWTGTKWQELSAVYS